MGTAHLGSTADLHSLEGNAHLAKLNRKDEDELADDRDEDDVESKLDEIFGSDELLQFLTQT